MNWPASISLTTISCLCVAVGLGVGLSASGTPKYSSAACAPANRGLPDITCWYTLCVNASGDYVVCIADVGSIRLSISSRERIAPCLLVRRVDQHPVDVEDRARKGRHVRHSRCSAPVSRARERKRVVDRRRRARGRRRRRRPGSAARSPRVRPRRVRRSSDASVTCQRCAAELHRERQTVEPVGQPRVEARAPRRGRAQPT